MSTSGSATQFAEYRGRMQPDLSDAAVGFHEADRLYTGVYSHPEWYGHGEPKVDRETVAQMHAARGNPDAQVTIHRAVPPGVEEINPGDWVSTSRSYAQQHGMHPTDSSKDWPVLSRVVPARTVREGSGNSMHEWGYQP